jgi:hypothetical protein
MPSHETSNEPTISDEVPKNDESASGNSITDQKNNSVYDFLYHDVRRIASFLAQFQTYGVLQQIKATESVGRSGTSKTVISGDLGVPLVAKGSATLDGTVVDDERDAAERTYDPLWTNARLLLNYLAEREMIVRDPSKARVGQFVLFSGALAAFDLGIIKDAWKLQAVKDSVIRAATSQDTETPSKNRHDRRNASRNQKAPALNPEMAAGFELMQIMPHTIQATIRQDTWTAWSILREDSLVVQGSELLLKHGVAVAGTWNMLGILDALPQEDTEVGMQTFVLDQLLASLSLGALAGQIVGNLAPTVRAMLGRPTSAYGMTPLLIFREVSNT